MKTLEQVSKEALQLPESSRILLAEQLLDSLDQPDQQRIEALWAEEIERRLACFERGQMQSIPAEEVFHRIRSRVRR